MIWEAESAVLEVVILVDHRRIKSFSHKWRVGDVERKDSGKLIYDKLLILSSLNLFVSHLPIVLISTVLPKAPTCYFSDLTAPPRLAASTANVNTLTLRDEPIDDDLIRANQDTQARLWCCCCNGHVLCACKIEGRPNGRNPVARWEACVTIHTR